MDGEQPRYFTLMVMPETSAIEPRRIRISRRWIHLAIASFVLVIFGAIGAIVYSIHFRSELGQVEALRAENDALRNDLTGLDTKVAEMTVAIDRVQKFESKLRALTMVSDPERNLAMGPVGGAVEAEKKKSPLALKPSLLPDAQRAAGHTSSTLAWLQSATDDATERAGELSAFLQGQRAMLSSTPSRRPCRGYVTSRYGMRVDPFTGLANFHSGVDFSGRLGAPVYATADGVVIGAGRQGAFGNMIEVDHGHGLVTRYGHLEKMHVKVGAEVVRGGMIGAVGNTGRSTGPHLHYEIRMNGLPQDPRRFILE